MSKKETEGTIILLLLLSPVFLVFLIADKIGWFITIIILVSGGYLLYKQNERNTIERRKTLKSKYKSEKIVNRIMEHSFWIGQTEEQLIDSLGKPDDVDSSIGSRNRRETWKYSQDGINRFKRRIFLSDGIVTGWKDRS